jgi:hypothetical protein
VYHFTHSPLKSGALKFFSKVKTIENPKGVVNGDLGMLKLDKTLGSTVNPICVLESPHLFPIGNIHYVTWERKIGDYHITSRLKEKKPQMNGMLEGFSECLL